MQYKINNDRILFSPLDQEAVVFDKETNEYLSLNETMFFIFKEIGNGLTAEQIQEKLLEVYEVEVSHCEAVTKKSILELLAKGLILENK
jgi:hypothetical protein